MEEQQPAVLRSWGRLPAAATPRSGTLPLCSSHLGCVWEPSWASNQPSIVLGAQLTAFFGALLSQQRLVFAGQQQGSALRRHWLLSAAEVLAPGRAQPGSLG